MKFGFVGPSYTAKSNAVADEECINFFAETNETPGAQTQRSYFGTPGLKVFTDFSTPESETFTNANGQLWMVHSRPLDDESHGIIWSDFALDGPLPSDADIQGIYPVIIASGHHDQAEQHLGYGYNLVFLPLGVWSKFLQPFDSNPISPPADFSNVEFWDASVGTTLAALTNANIAADLDQSISANNMTDYMQITAVGYAVYYTSATPVIGPEIPPPFAVPAGQGLAWAIPATATPNEPGQVVNVISSELAGGTATYGYTPVTGPALTVGQILTVAGTTNASGGLNGAFLTVLMVSGGFFTTAGPGGAAALQSETAVAVIGDSPVTGAAEGSPASLVVIPAEDNSPTRGECWTGDRLFVAAADSLFEVFADGTNVKRMDGTLDVFGGPVSIAFSSIELLIVAGGRAWAYELADNTFTDVTSQLASGPSKVKYSDGYFVVMFPGTNKFQISAILDGTTWPGIQVNAVSVFAENIVSIEVSHRELWIFGSQHAQPYQDTGTDEIFDVIPGALIETGGAAEFGVDVVDNTVFWVSQDIRGARQAWRANGYTPSRISTHAVETALSSYTAAQIANLVSYSYQDGGHLFWVLYIPGTDCTWVYDVAESLWHKRAEWHQDEAIYTPHRSWNHAYAFGKHLVGDWESSKLNEMNLDFLDENGELIRRLRRSPTLVNEMEWIYHAELIVDFATGLGPQPPLVDGDGNPRPPQAMLRWSNNRGSTWSNQHIANCGFAGEYNTRVIWRRLGRSRYRVYELSVTDPIPWAIVDAYLEAS